MIITEISKLSVGDTFKYNGKRATVFYKRPPYPPETVWLKDEKGNGGKWVTVADKTVAIGFETEDGEKVGLSSNVDSKMIANGVYKNLELSNYEEIC